MAFDTKVRVLWALLAIPGVLLGIGASYKSGGLSGLRELAHDALQSVGLESEPSVVPKSPLGPGAGSPSIALSADEIFWLTIKDSGAPALFEEFLRKFPASPHVKQAQSKLQELKSVAARNPPGPQTEGMPMSGSRRGPMMKPPGPDNASPSKSDGGG
jgi:hypothetical protein